MEYIHRASTRTRAGVLPGQFTGQLHHAEQLLETDVPLSILAGHLSHVLAGALACDEIALFAREGPHPFKPLQKAFSLKRAGFAGR